MAAREFLEPLVRIGQAGFAHDGLDRLREDFPVGGEIGSHFLRPDLRLAEALLRRGDGNQRMRERRADIADGRGIGEVALETRHRQLAGQVAKDRVGKTDVAFTVLESGRSSKAT